MVNGSDQNEVDPICLNFGTPSIINMWIWLQIHISKFKVLTNHLKLNTLSPLEVWLKFVLDLVTYNLHVLWKRRIFFAILYLFYIKVHISIQKYYNKKIQILYTNAIYNFNTFFSYMLQMNHCIISICGAILMTDLFTKMLSIHYINFKIW